jgi:hypothetical protein
LRTVTCPVASSKKLIDLWLAGVSDGCGWDRCCRVLLDVGGPWREHRQVMNGRALADCAVVHRGQQSYRFPYGQDIKNQFLSQVQLK